MTNQTEHDDPRASAGDDASASDKGGIATQKADPAEGAASHSPETEKEKGKRKGQGKGSGSVAWIALLLALVSMGLASFPFWSGWTDLGLDSGPSVAEVEALAGRVQSIEQEADAAIEEVRAGLAQLAADLKNSEEASRSGTAALAERVEQVSARIERLQGEHNTSLGGLRSRIEELETEIGRQFEKFELRLSDLGGDLDRADQELAARLLLIEVDSLFAVAQDQLAVLADADAARQAWARGMERLAALDGARFRDLKQQARSDFERLQAFDAPDIPRRVDRLYALAAEVEEWPAISGASEGPGVADADDEGWGARLGAVFGDLVKVESTDRQHLAPAAIDLARDQVATTLQTAALALVRSRRDLVARLAEEAIAQIERVFDPQSQAVSGALAWLEEMAAGDQFPEPPVLTASRAEISSLLEGMR